MNSKIEDSVKKIDACVKDIRRYAGKNTTWLQSGWDALRAELMAHADKKPGKPKPTAKKGDLGKRLAEVPAVIKKIFARGGKSVKPVAEELPLKKGDAFKTPDGRTYRYSGNGVARPQKPAEVIPDVKKAFDKDGKSDKVKSTKKAEAKKQQGVSEYGMGVEAFKKSQVSTKSYRIDDHEVSLNLGGFPVRALAERDAKELLTHPEIFWYRQTMFPDPKAAKVQPTIVTATVSERSSAKFTRSPYTVFTVIRIDGEVKNCRAWAEGVVARNKGDQE